MPRRRTTLDIPSLGALDRGAGQVGRQLAQGLRNAIRNGDLKPGESLPSTRTLASSLGLARGTVMQAFEQLQAEGFLEARTGAGTRVALALQHSLPLPSPDRPASAASAEMALPPRLQRLADVARAFVPQPPIPFAVAVPTGAAAPDELWRRLGNRLRATGEGAPSGYGDPQGLPALRQAIADHVRKARAVRCDPAQVVITSGAQQGLYVAARLLVAPGDAIWTEDPAYPALTSILAGLGMGTELLRVPVDDEGIDVDFGVRTRPGARVAFVTPSHQYPMGVPMSMARRSALLSWASQHEAWIVEDDYDSELRYAGHPFPSLQGLDPARVLYLGTFSKILFPSLRLGYAVVPERLVQAFTGARALIDRHPPTADQHVLAAFMQGGHLEAHVRRIRAVYASRRTALIDALGRWMPDGVALQPSDQGMHLVVWLGADLDDVQVAADAAAAGITVRPTSTMYAVGRGRSGLILGFGGFTETQIEAAVKQLVLVITEGRRKRKYRPACGMQNGDPARPTARSEAMQDDPYDLQRFVTAQDPVYAQVRAELAAGAKTSHWMWFVFPQLKALGRSATAQHYGLASRAEAEAYWRHPLIGARLKDCAELVLAVQGRTAQQIFGGIDELKFRSCMTLFAQVAPEEPVFGQALQKYFGGAADPKTLELLGEA